MMGTLRRNHCYGLCLYLVCLTMCSYAYAEDKMSIFNEHLDLLEESEIVLQSKIDAVRELAKSVPDGQVMPSAQVRQVIELLSGYRVITGGSYQNVFIGTSKAEVIKGLRQMGVEAVTGDSKDRIIVGASVDLHLLDGTDRVTVRSYSRNIPAKERLASLGFVNATIQYNQQKVTQIEFVPDFDYLASAFQIRIENTARGELQQVKLRDHVKAILGPFLDKGMITVSRDAVIKFLTLSRKDEVAELVGFDHWAANIKIADGLGSLRLYMKFEASKLTELCLYYTPYI